MDQLYENIIRPILFTQNPEFAHDLGLNVWKVVGAVSPLRKLMETFTLVKTEKPVRVMGLEFPNRVGLAAGFDSVALGLDVLTLIQSYRAMAEEIRG